MFDYQTASADAALGDRVGLVASREHTKGGNALAKGVLFRLQMATVVSRPKNVC